MTPGPHLLDLAFRAPPGERDFLLACLGLFTVIATVSIIRTLYGAWLVDRDARLGEPGAE